jgi:hypothetical protein
LRRWAWRLLARLPFELVLMLMLMLMLARAPSAFDLEGVRKTEGSAHAARGLCAPEACKLRQFFVVQQGQLLRGRWGNHGRQGHEVGMRAVSRCLFEAFVQHRPIFT